MTVTEDRPTEYVCVRAHTRTRAHAREVRGRLSTAHDQMEPRRVRNRRTSPGACALLGAATPPPLALPGGTRTLLDVKHNGTDEQGKGLEGPCADNQQTSCGEEGDGVDAQAGHEIDDTNVQQRQECHVQHFRHDLGRIPGRQAVGLSHAVLHDDQALEGDCRQSRKRPTHMSEKRRLQGARVVKGPRGTMAP